VTILVGGGASSFVSLDPSTLEPNWDVYGSDSYIEISPGIGLGTDIPLTGGFRYVTTEVGHGQFYAHFLDIEDFKSDILEGTASPIWIWTDRRWAAQMAQLWYEGQQR
jgi:hypothetical protein